MEKTECNRCRGMKFVHVKLRNLGGREPHGLLTDATEVCPQCDGKGYVDESDRKRIHASY